MGNIAVGSEYLPILQNHYISKVQSKVADRVNENNAPGIIDGCAIVGQF